MPVSSLLFDRHRLQGIVAVVSGDDDDLVHHLHSPEDLAEDDVGSVQPAVVRDAEVELRAVIVGIPCAVALSWHLGYADRASLVRET